MTELRVRRDSKSTVSISCGPRVLLTLDDDEVLDVAWGLIYAIDEHGPRGRWCHHGGCSHWFEPECSGDCDLISAVSNPPATPDLGVEP